MASLEVEYLDSITLKNPIIVASSPYTAGVESVVNAERAGAGAVVLKSIFEEQINQYSSVVESMGQMGAESADYAAYYVQNSAIERYERLIVDCKERVSIPVIASINCTKEGRWVEYAERIERSGADALQLNIFYIAGDAKKDGATLEKEYLSIVEKVVKAVKIPICVKLPQNFTSLPNMIYELYVRGVKGVTLFNRFATVDIDIESQAVVMNKGVYSSASEIRDHIRTMAICSSAVARISYSASTGVHSGEDVIKMLLAGATTVEICSTIHHNGVDVISKMVTELDNYLCRHENSDVDEIIGLLSYKRSGEDAQMYERAQFMQYYANSK